MPLSSSDMRLLILLCAFGMVLLAVFFLRERRLSLTGYLGWGLLALLLPFLGPFLVILSCPGKPLRHRKPRRSHLKSWRGRLRILERPAGLPLGKWLTRLQRYLDS